MPGPVYPVFPYPATPQLYAASEDSPPEYGPPPAVKYPTTPTLSSVVKLNFSMLVSQGYWGPPATL